MALQDVLKAPLNLFDQLGSDAASAFRHMRHPVFDGSGQVVGSYDTLDALCQGQWFLDPGAKQPPVSQLYVVDFWGRRVPLATQCTRAAIANAGGQSSLTQPQAVLPASAVTAQAAASADLTGQGDPAADLVDLQGPTLDQASAQQWGTYALWGGVGLLGLLLVTTPPRRGRR